MLHEITDREEAKRLHLPMNENHRVLQWGDKQTFVSYTKKGDAISIHLAADRNGKRHLRKAVNAFCELVFQDFEWCRMVIGVIGPKSILNMSKKCGFELIATGEKDGKPAYLVTRKRACLS